MRSEKRVRLLGLLVVCTAAALVAGVGDEPARPPCCFQNPDFAGTCRVQPAQDETCQSILDYLNNPLSQGKSYCESTTLRGGWRQVACEQPKQE